MSPRRSSRARTTQPTPSLPQHTTSSTSSISSGRAERSTRSHHKLPSPRISVPRSQSLDDLDEPAKPQTRRTRNGQEESKENIISGVEDEFDEEGDEGVTRCICGHKDYPGLPTSPVETLKPAAKDSDHPLLSSEALPEDTGGFFIQCDVCKVWQHGGCVGILDEGMSPEEYFCEQCRKDLHKTTTMPNGQKHSRYLPVQEEPSLQASPEPSPQEGTSRKTRDLKSRPSAEALAHKRRSTMNSRDAAYDETEAVRRAIEESKKDGGSRSVDNGSRRNKRGRSDSEDRKDDSKRQRVDSGSSSSPPLEKIPHSTNSEDEETGVRKSSTSEPKKLRGAAARNNREKELQDREKDREKARADAAGRRKGRAERRRGDDSDPSEEPLSVTTSAKGADASTTVDPALLPSPDTPPTNQEPPPPKTSHKKSGRPPAKKGRVGRNQYTKNHEALLEVQGGHSWNGSLLDGDVGMKRRSRSRSVMQEIRDYGSHNANGNSHSYTINNTINGGGGGGNTLWGEAGKPSRPKHMNPNRTSMNEMKRRVAGILEFVSRTQVEMALASPRSGSGTRSQVQTPPKSQAVTVLSELSVSAMGTIVEGDDGGGEGVEEQGGEKDRDESERSRGGEMEFKALSSGEMMHVLAGKLEGWQREFGRWGEK